MPTAISGICALLLMLACLAAPAARGDAWLIEVDDAIGPATADHFVRGLAEAEEAGAELVILRLDTPGGLDTSMRDMIRAMLAAGTPVVTYVSPSGARAASAGTYLMYASHVAAMAPATNLGAATPVQMGAPGLPGGRPPTGDGGSAGESAAAGEGGTDGEGDKGGGGKSAEGKAQPGTAPVPGTATERKAVNDAVAYIQGLAQLRGRNAEWAERAVREGVSLSAEDALAANVIDLIATDMADLLAQLDGREVRLGDTSITLETSGLAINTHELDWRSEFLAVITNPNVAYILMLVGIYGLLLEFYNPGVGLPGVMGAISLLLALYAFQALPVSYAGMGLIVLGIALMTAEAFAPSFGVLGLGGIVAFIVGSVMLMDTEVPAYQIAWPTILAVAVFSAGLLIFTLGMLVRARHRAVVSGLEHLTGARAVVETVSGGTARVRLEGELWKVRCDQPLTPGDEVRVQSVDGLTLQVDRNSATGAGSKDNV